ncbi:hypothetical protein [Streptomyces sp. NPDC021212]|uniref:hypothetical protein n=1 Tax=Streptomyces sp. NPDC021212 TaxID=3365118 RepID=UPI0037B705FF
MLHPEVRLLAAARSTTAVGHYLIEGTSSAYCGVTFGEDTHASNRVCKLWEALRVKLAEFDLAWTSSPFGYDIETDAPYGCGACGWEDRAPLVLREHPDPLNLDVLDAGLAIEHAVFELDDTLAAVVQHARLDEPRRWNYRSATDPGSRAYGLHWAAVWTEGRLVVEDAEPELLDDGCLAAAPFTLLPAHLLHEARRTASMAKGRLLRTLGLDARSTPVPDHACLGCAGDLELHTGPDTAPSVTCSTGAECAAPVPLDE